MTEKDRIVRGIVRWLRDQAKERTVEAGQLGPSYPAGAGRLLEARTLESAADHVAEFWYEGDEPL